MQQSENLEGHVGGEPTMVELTNISLVFGRALSLILEENQGLVVDTTKEMQLNETVKKVIVFKMKDKIHIYKCDEDLPEGTPLSLDSNNLENTTE